MQFSEASQASMVQALPSLQSVSQLAKHAPARSPCPKWADKALSLMVMVWKLLGFPGGMWHTWTFALPAHAAEADKANSAIRTENLKPLPFIYFSFSFPPVNAGPLHSTLSKRRRGGACLRPKFSRVSGGGKLRPYGKQATPGVVANPYPCAFTRRPVTVSVAIGSPVSVVGSSGSSPPVNSRTSSEPAMWSQPSPTV